MTHLSKGSGKPAQKGDTLRLYNMRFCPFAQVIVRPSPSLFCERPDVQKLCLATSFQHNSAYGFSLFVKILHFNLIKFFQRARLVLKAKGIEYDCVNINLKDRPDWFYELNPLGKVPVIEMPDGKVLYESAICCGELKWRQSDILSYSLVR